VDDLLVRGFFDTLRTIQNILRHSEEDGRVIDGFGIQEYSRQLLYDFVRVLFLANMSTLGRNGEGSARVWYVLFGLELTVVRLVG
jgi:hypothetical protein